MSKVNQVERVQLTPAVAEKLLKLNHMNRVPSPAVVDTYARDMLAGHWTESNDAIAIGKDGTLYNGQHRCMAVVKSGVTIPVIIVQGLDEETRMNMDAGRKRSQGDNYDMTTGETNGRRLYEVARIILTIVKNRGQSSANEKNDILEKHRKGIEWAEATFPAGRKGPCSANVRGAMAFAYDAQWKTDKKLCPMMDEFVKRLTTGVGNFKSETDPVLLLKRSLESRTLKISARDTAIKTLRAVMAYVRNEDLRMLQATNDAAVYWGKMLGYDIKSGSEDASLLRKKFRTRGGTVALDEAS